MQTEFIVSIYNHEEMDPHTPSLEACFLVVHRCSGTGGDYEQIKRGELCKQIIKLEKGLDEQDQVKLYKMSILVQPLRYKRLAKYLGMDQKNTDLVRPFVKRLIENRIFDQRFKWFRHDLQYTRQIHR